MQTTLARLLTALVLTGAALVGVGAPASASVGVNYGYSGEGADSTGIVPGRPIAAASSAAAAPASESRYCAIDLNAHRSACAATPAEARTRAANGAQRGSVVLARFYENKNFGPTKEAPLTMYGNPCTARTTDIEYTIADLTKKYVRDTTWNDRISSLRTYNGCDAKLFENTGGGGNSTGFIDQHSDLGGIGWNDRTSSIRLS